MKIKLKDWNEILYLSQKSINRINVFIVMNL